MVPVLHGSGLWMYDTKDGVGYDSIWKMVRRQAMYSLTRMDGTDLFPPTTSIQLIKSESTYAIAS